MGNRVRTKPKLKVPAIPGESGGDFDFIEMILYENKLVADYTNSSIDNVLSLAIDKFRLYFKYAYISKLRETKEGQEHLKKCERLKITTPDFDKLRKHSNYTIE